MIAVTIFNSIVVFFASLARSEKTEYWLKISFVLIFLFLALRYDYGNDYQQYLLIFNNTESVDYYSTIEPGWQILVLLFKPMGFFAMVAFLAAINCYVYYHLIKSYVPKGYYWLAVFIYVFWTKLMLVQSSGMRQSLAVLVFIVSLEYLYKKNIIRYFLCILLASAFHRSVLFFLPLGLLLFVEWRMSWLILFMIILFYSLISIFVDKMPSFIVNFIGLYFLEYDLYVYRSEGGEINSGLAYFYSLFLFVLVLVYSLIQENERLLFFKVVAVGYFFAPLALIAASVGRMSMYTESLMVVVFPVMLKSIKKKPVKILVLFSYIFFLLGTYYKFFGSEIWREAFQTYKTIFSAPRIY